MENKSYYVIVPANVRYDKRLKANEKLLYGELVLLAQQKGYSWATNAYFAELYNVNKVSISRWISNLEQCGYIKTECIRDDTSEVVERRVYICDKQVCEDQKLLGDSVESSDDENVNTPVNKNDITPINNFDNPPINKNVKDNNTSINNTRININTTLKKEDNGYTKQKKLNEDIRNIIEYLNTICSTSFKTNNKDTTKLIRKHFKSGFTVDDFKNVIDLKYEEWGKSPFKFSSGKMSDEYLRPTTLFGDKFESYVYEALVRKVSEGIDNSRTVEIDPVRSTLTF